MRAVLESLVHLKDKLASQNLTLSRVDVTVGISQGGQSSTSGDSLTQ